MKFKKILAGVLASALTMTAGIIPQMTASAEEDYLSYEKVDEDMDGTYDCVLISGCDASAVSVEIPSKIDDLPVTTISDQAFNFCTSLVSVTIPDSVTTISDQAFNFCTSLVSVTIPDSLTTIGDMAFYFCTSLESVTIPDSVTTIGNGAFYSCASLASVTIPDSVTTIGAQAFLDCESLESITIPDSVTTIGSGAFYGTALLDNQTGAIKYADTWVVDCDRDITEVEIKEGTKGIGGNAFSGRKSISSVTIPDSVTSIGGMAFFECTSLESVTIPDSVTTIEYEVFSDCKSLKSITIPDSITKIGERAFYNCTSLKSITILNPDCEIYDSGQTISNGVDIKYNGYFNGTIYGCENSTAQAYAEKYGYKFESLTGESPSWSVADIIALQNFLVKKTDSIGKNYDLNNDGILNVLDLVILKRKVIYG